MIQVITATCSINYAYDSYGNRISKTCNGKTEYYIYQGINEIAIVDNNGEVEQLRIPGLSTDKNIFRAIAIETKNGVYAPIHNVQGNIIRLIDIATKKVISIDACDPYGRALSNKCPTAWIFSGKHYDADANLIYFGSRYYSPKLRQWLTRDPLQQTQNLYQFCFDNPFAYMDPDGQWAVRLIDICWGAGYAVTFPFWSPATLVAAAGASIAYLGYEAYNNWMANSDDTDLIVDLECISPD